MLIDRHVFVSHSQQDEKWVESVLLPELARVGLSVYRHVDFPIGPPKVVNIEQAVRRSRRTVVVCTLDWLNSEWGEFDAMVVATRDLLRPRNLPGPEPQEYRLLPVLLRECPLPEWMRILDCADLTDADHAAEQFDRLVRQLVEDLAPPPPDGPPPAFVAGPPIPTPVSFFGREQALTRLFNLWKKPPLQHAAVIGRPRTGKTSLLLHLRQITTTPTQDLRPEQRSNWLAHPNRYRWIFVDFQDPRLGTRAGLLHHLLIGLGFARPDPCDLQQFMNLAANRIAAPTV